MQVQDRSAPENPDRATVVGLRNGHDKCFPAGIMAGDAPFVCSNLQFNNEIVIARRHTKNIDNVKVDGNIFQKIANAIGQLRESWISQEKRVGAYKEYDLSSTSEANDLIIRAFQNGACSKTQIADIVGQWNTPNHDEFKDRNLYSLYNSFSEVWKGNLGLLLIVLPNSTLYSTPWLKPLKWWRFNPPHFPLLIENIKNHYNEKYRFQY